MNKIDFKKSLMVFECCRVVRGFTKSIIYDLQRNKNQFIPNDLANLLKNINGKKILDILELYPSEYHSVLLENISILIDEEYLFYTDTPERFPLLSLEWDEPCKISNAIIEYGPWIEKC